MGKLMQGIFTPKNPQKYIGKNVRNITYRSSWELAFMNTCDNHPYITQWASECVDIPYRNPISGKWQMYRPDFLVIFVDKNMKQHCEMIEIKPAKEMPWYTGKIDKNTKLVQTVNAAKFAAAHAFCVKRGWKFRVVDDKNLFCL